MKMYFTFRSYSDMVTERQSIHILTIHGVTKHFGQLDGDNWLT